MRNVSAALTPEVRTTASPSLQVGDSELPLHSGRPGAEHTTIPFAVVSDPPSLRPTEPSNATDGLGVAATELATKATPAIAISAAVAPESARLRIFIVPRSRPRPFGGGNLPDAPSVGSHAFGARSVILRRASAPGFSSRGLG